MTNYDYIKQQAYEVKTLKSTLVPDLYEVKIYMFTEQGLKQGLQILGIEPDDEPADR